jgi:hypothetical protein
MFWHKLTHRFRPGFWENIEHLSVPGYQNLYRQRCRVCGETRMQDLRPQA